MKRFEVKVVHDLEKHGESVQAVLNSFGAEGWELVGVDWAPRVSVHGIPEGGLRQAVFKREVPVAGSAAWRDGLLAESARIERDLDRAGAGQGVVR